MDNTICIIIKEVSHGIAKSAPQQFLVESYLILSSFFGVYNRVIIYI